MSKPIVVKVTSSLKDLRKPELELLIRELFLLEGIIKQCSSTSILKTDVGTFNTTFYGWALYSSFYIVGYHPNSPLTIWNLG